MTSLRHFRDGLFVVAAYFAVCAAVTDPQQAHLKDIAMQDTATPTAPEGIRADVAITWHHYFERPTDTTTALISIRAPVMGNEKPVLLPELYVWDVDEGYWVSASSHLRIRHKEFYWAPTAALLASAP